MLLHHQRDTIPCERDSYIKTSEMSTANIQTNTINDDKWLSFWDVANQCGRLKRWLHQTFWVFLNRIFFRQSSTICAWVNDVNTTDYSNWQSKQLNSVSYSCDYPCLYDVGAAVVVEKGDGGLDYGQIRNKLKVRERGLYSIWDNTQIGLSFRNSGLFDRVDQSAVRTQKPCC